ncbi:MAG: YwaF family protein [Clostridia bacterium]|nr:YwaF family protein [Clostridia bacterium]
MGNFHQKIEFATVTKNKGVTLFEQLLAALDGQMNTPTWFGWFHILCLAVVIGLCVLIVLKCRNISDRKFNLALGITAGVLLLLEVYKQFNFTYDHATDSWEYSWYAFPFQFCSTPMYVMLAASLIQNEKVKRSLCSFLATYGLFAGTAVMLYPNDVFIGTIGINIQTMVHHGMMVVMGVFMYVSGKVKLSHKTILYAIPTFCVLVAIALTGNILYGEFGDPEQTFNMFYISPYYPCTLPVLSAIYNNTSYPLFLFCYIFGFTAAGYVMSLMAMGIEKLTAKIKLGLAKRA